MARWENCIGYGLLADRPLAGAPGALYFTSDTSQSFRDNGTSWDEIGGRGHYAVQAMSTANITIASGNTFVVNTGNGQTASLPLVATSKGQIVIVTNANSGVSNVATQGADTFVDGSTTQIVGDNSHVTGNFGSSIFVCDGTHWFMISHAFSW